MVPVLHHDGCGMLQCVAGAWMRKSLDQIAGKFIDVLSIADVVDLAAAGEQAPAIGSRVGNRSHQVCRYLAIKRSGIDIGDR